MKFKKVYWMGLITFVVALAFSSVQFGFPKVATSQALILNTQVNINSKLSDFRVNNQVLFRQHAVLASLYIQKLIKGEDTTAIKGALNKNSSAIEDVVGGAYGGNVKSKFTTSWNQHIKDYEDYAKAGMNADTDSQTKAKNDLNTIAVNTQNLFTKANKKGSAAKLGAQLKDHANMTLMLIDAMISNNDAMTVTLMGQGYDQAGRIADAYTQMVASEFPNKY